MEDDQYFLTVLRYIRQNPVKAGMVNDLAEHPWSSYREIIGKPQLVDAEFVLGLFDNSRERAIEQFRAFHANEEDHGCLEGNGKNETKDVHKAAL